MHTRKCELVAVNKEINNCNEGGAIDETKKFIRHRPILAIGIAL